MLRNHRKFWREQQRPHGVFKAISPVAREALGGRRPGFYIALIFEDYARGVGVEMVRPRDGAGVAAARWLGLGSGAAGVVAGGKCGAHFA